MGKFEGIIWIIIGLIIWILALRFEIGSFRSPGPGFLPMFSGLFILTIGLIMLIDRIVFKRKYIKKSEVQHKPFIISWKKILHTLILLLIYIIFFERIGFMIMTFLLMFGLFFDFEKKNYILTILFSLSASFLSYIVFEVWLSCQLPKGIFP